MYIRETAQEKELQAPPDYSGHTYQPPVSEEEAELPCDGDKEEAEESDREQSAPVGAFSGQGACDVPKSKGKRGELFGASGLNGLFSRVPFLSSLLPPPRPCDEKKHHSELWDWALLAVVALCFLEGKSDDVIPILLLLLLWD